MPLCGRFIAVPMTNRRRKRACRLSNIGHRRTQTQKRNVLRMLGLCNNYRLLMPKIHFLMISKFGLRFARAQQKQLLKPFCGLALIGIGGHGRRGEQGFKLFLTIIPARIQILGGAGIVKRAQQRSQRPFQAKF